ETAGPEQLLQGVDGILVPGGFGDRGIEGKVQTARYARERAIPYLGICLGMQLAVVEASRNLLGLEGAHSAEFDPHTPHPVIDLMPEQKEVRDKGGTMRLGRMPCVLREGTKAYEAYGQGMINERHRHRYEVNREYWDRLAEAGIVIS